MMYGDPYSGNFQCQSPHFLKSNRRIARSRCNPSLRCVSGGSPKIRG